MPTNNAQLSHKSQSQEQQFDLAFDNIKELILSRAWCMVDYQRMTLRLENIRKQMKTHCCISYIANQPAIVEHVVMLVINNDVSVSDACCGLDIFDSWNSAAD